MNRTFWILIICLVGGWTAASAFAQDNEDGASAEARKKIIYRKQSTVDFSDAVIEGKNTNPEGIYVVTPPARKFKGLLRLRPNFHRELIRDSLLLK
jgi:hypothetical protein